MYTTHKNFSLDEYAKIKNLKQIDIDLIIGFMELDSSTRSALYGLFKNLFEKKEEKMRFNDYPKSPEELEKNYPPMDLKQNKQVMNG